MPFQTTNFFVNHASSASASDIMQNAKEFIPGKLYFTSLSQTPQQYNNVHFFTIDNTLVYINFYADIGPLNMAHVFRFCEIMIEKLQSPALENKRICLYSSMDKAKRANAAYLMCVFMMLVMKQTPEQAYAPLSNIHPPFVNFRDAGYGAATYHLSVLDCLRGLYKGIQTGLFHLDKFDLQEYEFYEKVENGDLNWMTSKFIALASPKDDQNNNNNNNAFAAYLSSRNNNIRSNLSQKTVHGKDIFSAYKKSDLIRFLKDRGVCTIVRLNNNVYEKRDFVEAGIEHVELYFPDGSTPPEGILKRFIDLCESRKGVIAVHCKAGLGRTGSLIGAYLMKHFKLSASEVISFMRIIRPGSVVGPQQNWLESMQSKLWRLHPQTALPRTISLIEPNSFDRASRFTTGKVLQFLEICQRNSNSSSIEEDSGRMSIDDPITPVLGDEDDEDEYVDAESYVEETTLSRFGGTHTTTTSIRTHHQTTSHGRRGDDEIEFEDFYSRDTYERTPMRINNGSSGKRGGSRSNGASKSNHHPHQQQQQQMSRLLSGANGSMGTTTSQSSSSSAATGNTSVGKFVLEDYTIPVQPRKGKRGAQPDEELFQTRAMQDFNNKKHAQSDSEPDLYFMTGSNNNNNSGNQQQHNGRYPMYVNAANHQQVGGGSGASNQNSMNGFVLRGQQKNGKVDNGGVGKRGQQQQQQQH